VAHHSGIEVGRKNCQSVSREAPEGTAADLWQACYSQNGCNHKTVAPAGLDVQRERGRDTVMGVVVDHKRKAVVTHGLSMCGTAVREAAAACDASAMADRCTNPAVDVFPLGLFRPSHVRVNRKSICSSKQPDQACCL